MRRFGFYIAIILGLAVAALSLQTPAPVSKSAPADQFSALRAYDDIQAIAKAPHPVGSAEHDRVRDYLLGRLTGLGLKPEIYADMGMIEGARTYASFAHIEDIIAVMPGKNPNLPALLVMSHYDTQLHSPGAADDTAGIAASLEMLRAFRSGPQPERDVIFLYTDGEELGLLGAEAFFRNHPLAKHVGQMINMETRGDSGLAAMFETGAGNASLIGLYAAHAQRPFANSLSDAVYHKMPNGTDFTMGRLQAKGGLNFAFSDDELAYHTPLATPAHLNLGSVQHMGDQAWPVAHAIAMSKTEPKATGDAIYSDVLSLFLIHYPIAWGYGVLAIIIALVVFAMVRYPQYGGDFKGMWRGGLVRLSQTLTVAAILWPFGRWLGQFEHFQRLTHFQIWLWVAIGMTLAVMSLFSRLMALGKARICLIVMLTIAGMVSNFWGFDVTGSILAALSALMVWFSPVGGTSPRINWLGNLIFGTAIGAALQVFFPQATPMVVWPVLISSLAFHLDLALDPKGEGHSGSEFVQLGVSALIIAQSAALGYLLFLALGVDLPAILAVLVPVMGLATAPLVIQAGQNRFSSFAGYGLMAASLLGVGCAVMCPLSAKTPVPVSISRLSDMAHKRAFVVFGFAKPDVYSYKALSAVGDRVHHEKIPSIGDAPQWWSETNFVDEPAPELSLSRKGDAVEISGRATPNAFGLLMLLRPDAEIKAVIINGRAVKVPLLAKTWNVINFVNPKTDALQVQFKMAADVKLKVRLIAQHSEWPSGAKSLPPRTPTLMPIYFHGFERVLIEKDLK